MRDGFVQRLISVQQLHVLTNHGDVNFIVRIQLCINYFIPLWASLTIRVVENFSIRAYYLEELSEARASAFDYYVFVRSAYLQIREHNVQDRVGQPPEQQDDLYEIEDE